MLTLPAGFENNWLGEFGERWFHILCTVAACESAKPEPDLGKVDRLVSNHDGEGIRIQVKCTSNPIQSESGYSFDLDVGTINRFRKGSSPAFLVLVIVHKAHPDWVNVDHALSEVFAVAYWARIDHMDEPSNGTTVRVLLPSENLLTPTSLLSLFPDEP
jgi:hypothetical protein